MSDVRKAVRESAPAEFGDREIALRTLLGEVLQRGNFDPFMPFDSLRKIALTPADRDVDEDAEWERRLAVFAETFSAPASQDAPEQTDE